MVHLFEGIPLPDGPLVPIQRLLEFRRVPWSDVIERCKFTGQPLQPLLNQAQLQVRRLLPVPPYSPARKSTWTICPRTAFRKMNGC